MKTPSIFNHLDNLTNEENAKVAKSRREMFTDVKTMLGKFALAGIPLAAAVATPGTLRAQSSGNDVLEVLNFALTLEYLEAEFYVTGLDSNNLLSGDTRSVIEQISKHETAHVEFLRQAISGAGGMPIDSPTFDFTAGGAFGDVFTNPQTFLAVAQAFEDTGVRAYKGQAANLISDPDVLTAALSIHGVEARHAAEIRRIRGSKGWIVDDNNTTAEAAAAVYAGEDNVTHLNVDATTVTTVTRDELTAAYDEPLSQMAVLDIAGLFLA